MLDKLNSADFTPYLHQKFYIRPQSAETVETELIEVAEVGSEPPKEEASQRRAFSLIFRGPQESHLPQRIYKVEHEAMGALELFLVPIGPDKKGMRYEALFS